MTQPPGPPPPGPPPPGRQWGPPAGVPAAPGGPPRGYAEYVPTTGFPTSTAVLLAVSVVSVVLVGIIGIPSAVIAVLAWRQSAHDPVGARRRTTTGWVTYAVNLVVGVALLVPFYAWALQNR